MEEFLILWRLELKLWRFFGEKNWGAFWRFLAKKEALSDLELLSTLTAKSAKIIAQACWTEKFLKTVKK